MHNIIVTHLVTVLVVWRAAKVLIIPWYLKKLCCSLITHTNSFNVRVDVMKVVSLTGCAVSRLIFRDLIEANYLSDAACSYLQFAPYSVNIYRVYFTILCEYESCWNFTGDSSTSHSSAKQL
jgi:hypothetical protein